MPRQARIVVPDRPHHITQRGNRQQDVFFCDFDRSFFLELILHYFQKFGVDLIGYTLMTNHVHFVAVPQNESSFHLSLKNIFRRYASYRNAIAGCTGHFWQERYFSSPLDERHFWTAMQYVELNPVRSGLVTWPSEYRWSSAKAHCLGLHDPVLAFDSDWHKELLHVKNWEAFLLSAQLEEINSARIRFNRGLPHGEESFLNDIETTCGRKLSLRPQGRPRKPGKTTVKPVL